MWKCMSSSLDQYAAMSVETVFASLKTTEEGLSLKSAEEKAHAAGPNTIIARKVSALRIFFRQFRSSLVYLLIAAAVISSLLGEHIDAISIAVILFVNIGLSFFQEFRSEHALKRLQKFVAHTAHVKRGGKVLVIPRESLVIGDVVLFAPGDIVPADLRVVVSHGMLVDESVLTGESVPVTKQSVPSHEKEMKKSTILFGGTTVVSGTGEGVILAIGNETAFGSIAHLAIETEKASVFEQSVAQFSAFLMKIMVVTLFIVFFAKLFLIHDSSRVGELLLFSLALAVSIVPEALPAVMTVTFSRGALHLAKKKAVVKRLSAIEDLGHVDVLCTDKTGTITENHMRVTGFFSLDKSALIHVTLASLAGSIKKTLTHSSFDDALLEMNEKMPKSKLLDHVPFDPMRKYESVLMEDGVEKILVLKGAPEQILALCHEEGRHVLTKDRREAILFAFQEFGKQGMRVLAYATKVTTVSLCADVSEEKMEFAGLIGFTDPLKKTAIHALHLAKKLHVRVKILSGDGIEVTGAIAHAVGLIASSDDVVSGYDLKKMSSKMFAETVETHDVFARVTPEQKFKIIEVLEQHHAVGFLGEGINDAPALKRAHVGLAVQGATDVARDAADVILLDRSLAVIITAIQEGRVIFTNVAKYIRFTLSGNLGNLLSIAALSLLLPFLPMLPVQILLVNLLTDIPLLSIATDSVDISEVDRPRALDMRELGIYSFWMSLVCAGADVVFFLLFRHRDPAMVQTLWFIESSLQELVLIYSVRTRFFFLWSVRPSNLFLFLTTISAIIAFILPFVLFGQEVFHLITPNLSDIITILWITVLGLVLAETMKFFYYHNRKNGVAVH